MDSIAKNSVKSPPPKTPQSNRSKISEPHKDENQNPNLRTPGSKLSKSPSNKSPRAKTLKSAIKNLNPNPDFSVRKKIRERKFVVVKRNSKREKASFPNPECNCRDTIGNKCLCLAYESLRVSQDEFFKHRIKNEIDVSEKNGNNPDEVSKFEELGGSNLERERGKVMSLVKAFERLKTAEFESKDEREIEGSDRAETQISSQSLVSSSLESSGGSFTFSSKGSRASHRSRRNSTELSGIFGGRRWRKKQQLRATRKQPFKLLTEQRGRTKEEEFSKKLQEMVIQEQKQRIPIAQGLPWTTDEPENLVKPPVKEITIPADFVLHSDVRAVDRAEFDQQLAEKEALIEQWRMERERQQKIAEEEEIRRLRKELIPKAQPMPYFDRPFIPRRSEKDPTIPKEPKFHIPPHHKKIKSCLSSNDFSSYQK